MRFKKFAAVLLSAAMLSAAGCGNKIDDGATAVTLDDKEISMGVANFMAQYQAVQYDSYLMGYYGENMWTSDAGDGTTMTDSVKNEIMDRLQEFYLLDAHAADYDVSLSDEEMDEINAAADQFLADNSGDAIKTMGATRENVAEMLRLYKIQAKMREKIIAEADTEVSDEECAQKTFSYVEFRAEDDDSGDTSVADDVTDAALQTKADEFCRQAKDGDLEELAESNEYTVQKCSYGKDDLSEDGNSTSLDVAVLEAAEKLKDGETVSEAVEADDAYYVIRMDSTDDKDAAETKRQSIITERQDEKYDETLQGYKDACKWEINEEEWAKVNFEELYTIKKKETDTTADTSADAAGTVTDTTADAAGTVTDTAAE